MKDLVNVGHEEISNLIDAKEKELASQLDAFYKLEQEKLLLQREIIEKQLVKKDLEVALSKANQNLKQTGIELSLMRRAYWKVKG